ncbi:hypothetical protein [Mycobacterium sp. URHB0021]
MTATVVVAIDANEARRLTDRINADVEAVWELITQAYIERAWSALGYSSWDSYCTREFDTSRLRLPREERAEVVASLRESGLSLRAIAAATGISHTEARRSLDAGVTNVPPDGPVDVEVDEDALTEALIEAEPPPGGITDQTPGQTERVAEALSRAREAEPQPAVVIDGLDGKKYPQPERKPPRRKPLKDEAYLVGMGVDKITKRVEKVLADDRFADSREQVGCAILPWPIHAITALTKLNSEIDAIDPGSVLDHIAETLAAVVVECQAVRLDDVFQHMPFPQVNAIREYLDNIHDFIEMWSTR